LKHFRFEIRTLHHFLEKEGFMTTYHTIVPADHPALHRPADVIRPDRLTHPNVQKLILSMWGIMRAPQTRGIGMAAPQLGASMRIITVEDTAELQKIFTPKQLATRGRKPISAQTLINPEYEVIGDEQACFFEGCLTYPDKMRPVLRHRRIRVQALDARGNPMEFDATDWHARILQHEIDHLLGITLDDFDVVHGGAWMSLATYRSRECVHLTSDQIRTRFNI
jgi:peptide deformylase